MEEKRWAGPARRHAEQGLSFPRGIHGTDPRMAGRKTGKAGDGPPAQAARPPSRQPLEARGGQPRRPPASADPAPSSSAPQSEADDKKARQRWKWAAVG